MEKLPYVDEHAQPLAAPADEAWAALLGVLRRELGGASRFARLLGCDPARGTAEFAGRPGEAVPGFRIAEAEPGRRLVLRGRHRFSDYALTFALDEGRVRARTDAAFPGVLGRLYRAAVIGSGGHRLLTRRLLRQVARAASPGGRAGTPAIHAVVTAHVGAPAERVRALYEDVPGWARLFPATIRGARVVRTEGDATVVEVDHLEGKVVNRLRRISPTCVELEEVKRRYDATFANEFTPERGGTRYTLTAAVRLRWPYALVAPLARPLIVARMRRYVVEPLKAAAEASRE